MSKDRTRHLVLLALFVAIEAVMMYTPLGYLPIGPLQLTTLHIPVILAGILLGPADGAFIGLVFGITSVVYATTVPNAASFIFSPFYAAGGYSGSGWSLAVALVPRIVLGLGSGWLVAVLRRTGMRPGLATAVTAVAMTLVHSVLVLTGIYVFFGPQYAKLTGIEYSTLARALAMVVLTNSLLEAALAAAVCWPVEKAVHTVQARG